jgi:soluble lytic murein transglycosylase
MERGRKLSSKVLFLVLAVIGSGMPAQAQLSDATRSLYQARLADNAAGRYTGFSGSPLVGVTPIPALEAVVSWDRLRRDSYTGSFPEYALFLRSYPDWPQSLIIRRQAEKLIDDSVSARDRIAFFDKFPPLSAQAKLRLAEALQTVGRVPEAVATARDAWDSAGLDQLAETQLVARFGSSLTPADYLSRADRLLWSGQTTAASRLLPKLDADHRLWALARTSLRLNSSDAASQLAAVPAALRDDAGLILDRANWMKRNGDLSGA